MSATNLLFGFSAERKQDDQAARALAAGSLGRSYVGAIPTQDAIEFLSYPLVEGSVTTDFEYDGETLSATDPKRKTVVRADTGEIFGVFKNGYKIHQPREWLISNLELLLDDGLQIAQVRQVRGGAVAFVQVELPETMESAEGVRFRPWLTAATSHDGSLATTYFTGSTVLICENQMAAAQADARRNDSLVKIRHSANSLGRVGEMRERLGLIVAQKGDEFDQAVRKLTSEYVDDATWGEFVRALTGVEKKPEGRAKTMAENQVATLNRMWNEDERVAPWRNSAWGVVSAVNTASHHEFTVKGDRDERNALRTIDGAWEKLDSRTLSVLAEVR